MKAKIRAELFRRGETPPTRSAAQDKSLYANDVAGWINQFAVTYDPRLLPGDAYLPFHLFPIQSDLITWLQQREANQENGLIEKSRDSGATYLCCAYALHAWLYRKGFSAGFGSRKLDLVDTLGDPDSIFEKIRILLRNLPDWMKPAGFVEKRHSLHCRLVNPENGSTITGEGGDDIGRGGRKTVYFVDEFAFVEHAALIDASLSQTTRCRIDISTPNGTGNAFHQKRFSGNVPVFRIHWKDDPRKNRCEIVTLSDGRERVVYPWYEAEVKRIDDPVIVAQELDIDYTASMEGIVIEAKWVQAAVEFPLEASGYLTAGADIAAGGKNKSVLVFGCGPLITDVLTRSEGDLTGTAWWIADEAEARDCHTVCYDVGGVGLSIQSTWDSSPRSLPFAAIAVNSGQAPSETVWPSGKTSKELFLNRRAELWWKARRRFQKTYEHVLWLRGEEGGHQHPTEELISIPNHPQLIAELSMPTYKRTETGKIQIESKEKMRERGVASPDHADALVVREAEEGDWSEAVRTEKEMEAEVPDYQREMNRW